MIPTPTCDHLLGAAFYPGLLGFSIGTRLFSASGRSDGPVPNAPSIPKLESPFMWHDLETYVKDIHGFARWLLHELQISLKSWENVGKVWKRC